jgi:hypothetical protein
VKPVGTTRRKEVPDRQATSQVIYKNKKNVFADLSAILIGNAEAFALMKKEGTIERARYAAGGIYG